MPPNPKNPSAGSAEPSWFEWQTGLLHLVELLDEDSSTTAVAFQLWGTKGWDDVGVRSHNGGTRLMQMKHSRNGDTLTFGDLIESKGEHDASLLRALANAWKQEQEVRGEVTCELVTNRLPGRNWYEGRPPLAEFFTKVKNRISRISAIDEIHWDDEDERYASAWRRFLDELSDLEPSEQFTFLCALEIQTNAPDLVALEVLLLKRLSELTGLPGSSVQTVLNTLFSHLRKWTCHTRREAEWIDREALCACLAEEEAVPAWLGHCEVETPEPFFPSRMPVLRDLSASLLGQTAHKIDFLSAEPGAGKTSCASKLARSGAIRWQDQCISIRFYAYRPIRPGQPDIGGDTNGVLPEALWLGLLWQIRDHLRKTHLLARLRVPVWLHGMPWNVARDHVLRLANALGQCWERPFVICVDGIDHAARAQRKHLPHFLGTLPTPEAIPAHVRFFLAGQPADSYPEYPFFLRHPNVAVKVHRIGELVDDDIRLLWQSARPQVGVQAENAVLRLLTEKAGRRTLPMVYAVEDIRGCDTLEAAAAALEARPLTDSLHHYYDAIWSAASITPGESHRLAAAFALLRERPTGNLLASAFPDLGRSSTDWKDVLRSLRPLVRETAEEFELVHNDLRVHLEARLAGDPDARSDAASALADHYRKPVSNRLAAHWSLLDLLITAGREIDFADDFSVDWVIEAGALGVADDTLPRECNLALRAAISRRDWLILHEVGCASLTLHRLHECMHNWSGGDGLIVTKQISPFLRVEGEPLPLELWTADSFSEVVVASRHLVESGSTQRAGSVLKQWVGNIDLATLVQKVIASNEGNHLRGDVANALKQLFEQFGRLCALTGLPLAPLGGYSQEYSSYAVRIEIGWSNGIAERADRRMALRLWVSRPPEFFDPWIVAVKAAAARSRWGEVRALLNRIKQHFEHVDPQDRILLGWYAVRTKPKTSTLWSDVFRKQDFGLVPGNSTLFITRIVAQWLTYSDPLREPAQIAEEFFPMLNLRESDLKNPAAVRLLLRASAILGRILRYVDQGDFTGVEIAVPPSVLSPYLEALWCCKPDWRNLPDREVQTPGEIGRALAEAAWACGATYRPLLRGLATTRFAEVILDRDGPRVFEVLWELGERSLLTEIVVGKVQEALAHLHEQELSCREESMANLLYFTRRLNLTELEKHLSDRLGRTRAGYGCHKEWVFHPLVRWFEILRKQNPAAWRSEGLQLLALDRIAEQQSADNTHSNELVAEIAAAAMQCGPSDFEALHGFMANREAKSQLWDVRNATQEGLKTCLRDGQPMTEEDTLALISLSIAVGRWPVESPLSTISTLLTAQGVPAELVQHPAWKQALHVAAEIQGTSAKIKEDKRSQDKSEEPAETRNAETILAEILRPINSSWTRLGDIAALAQQARMEGHRDRAGLVAAALESLESARAFSRCLEFHDIRLMSRLHAHLTESEFWRLLGAITAVTGSMRVELSSANWAFVVAFAAINLACRARVTEVGHGFAQTIFHQLLAMHWKWHGIAPPQTQLSIRQDQTSWLDAARRMLLSLTHTDGCEPLYMAMCGLRFFADSFPGQIPALCKDGVNDERAEDAILSLAQLWATRYPCEIKCSLPDFKACESSGTLDRRLDAWVVNALHGVVTNRCPNCFSVPKKEIAPEIYFSGDTQLFEVDPDINGLVQHNSFSQMANKRLQRAGLVLGSMEKAFRHMVRTIRESQKQTPTFYLGPAKRLSTDENYPRPSEFMENVVGDAIMHQCAGQDWPASHAGAVRLIIGYGMDPWIASATPNPWPDNQTWPSEFEVEEWMEKKASASAQVAQKLRALVQGEDLAPDLILLGAELSIPTFRRDLEYRFWLTRPETDPCSVKRDAPSTPSGRTLAHWLAGWSFATSASELASVQFTGTLVNYPNGELDLTPTDYWRDKWGWRADPRDALRFRTPNGDVAAWHERFIGPDPRSRRVFRQPLLSRWVGNRKFLPFELNCLKNWKRNIDTRTRRLSRPE